jgi:hypothetical protein
VGEKETDCPADNEGEDSPYADLKFTQLEDVVVEHEDRGLDETKTEDGDAIQREFGL